MSNIFNNLYPPIVYDTQPAFKNTGSCDIYFGLSSFNKSSDIKSVQISLIDLRTNASVLNLESWPTGTKIVNVSWEEATINDSTNDYKYFVSINLSDLKNNGSNQTFFGLNQFYKAQLRFCKESYNPEKGDAVWLKENQDNFSEWSKVCLVKAISSPTLILKGLDDNRDLNADFQETTLSTSLTDIVGSVIFTDPNDKECLKSYQIKLYNNQDPNTVLWESDQIYTNPHNPNEINYQVLYDFVEGVHYIMKFKYTTNNLYTETKKYQFIIIDEGADPLDADITASPNKENGTMVINIKSKTEGQGFMGNLTIRRTSSKSDFKKWEDVKTIVYINEETLDLQWQDFTIESGVWYRYCAHRRNTYGARGQTIFSNFAICEFEDIFLTRKNEQLCIKFNPSLNEFKYNVTESQQVTIGAKYPYINRNGNNYFRTFPIGGLISFLSDTTNWYDPHFYDGQFHNSENELKLFTSKREIYKESKSLYDTYNQQNGITDYYDFIYEKQFRDKVYEFLYKHDIKLFRSAAEGNILIKLMNIDFQPVESLGRKLYSFTATAVEIDEVTVRNCEKYGIQTVGKYQAQVTYTHELLGQIQKNFKPEDGNILNTILTNKYSSSTNEGYLNEVKGLTSLKLTFESAPYVVVEQGSQLVQITASTPTTLRRLMGYVVEINGVEMLITPKMERKRANIDETSYQIINLGYFELKEDNTYITSLKFKYPVTATIDYVVKLEEKEDVSKVAKTTYNYYKPGQLYGTFNPQDSLMKKIYNKYREIYNASYQYLVDVDGIDIEAPPGTIVYIKDSKDDDFDRHVLQNGYLQLRDEDAAITDLYFSGILLRQKQDTSDTTATQEGEYTIMAGEYSNFYEVENPMPNGVYQITKTVLEIDENDIGAGFNPILLMDEEHVEQTDDKFILIIEEKFLNSNKYIYYHNAWYPFFVGEHGTGEMLHPINAIVNYTCQVVKGVY